MGKWYCSSIFKELSFNQEDQAEYTLFFYNQHFISNASFRFNKKPRGLITGRQGICSSENSPKTVVPVYITGHGIFKVQCTLHNVWGKVALIRLCILLLFLNKEAEAA